MWRESGQVRAFAEGLAGRDLHAKAAIATGRWAAECGRITSWPDSMDHDLLLKSRRIAVSGVEFDWLLVDDDGHVALCCSSIDGEIPDRVLEIEERQQDAFREAVAALAERLPLLGSFREESGGMGSDLVSPEFAKRGIYVFDWKPWSGPYRRMLVPTVTVSFSLVGPHLGHFRNHVPVANLSFAGTVSFQLPDLLPCR